MNVRAIFSVVWNPRGSRLVYRLRSADDIGRMRHVGYGRLFEHGLESAKAGPERKKKEEERRTRDEDGQNDQTMNTVAEH